MASAFPTPEAVRASAFIDDRSAQPLRLTETGPLADLSFAAKDLFDIEGWRTSWGNPDRLREPPAIATAPSVLTLLAAGASCVGKTHTDELALGIFGTNPHFGTPINPKAPDRVPGGSSSGSAAAVAAGLADFALGTDANASIRIPASFCGVYGLRTSHGRISTAGVMPMAPSLDTVGWLAADATIMRRVGEAFFGPVEKPSPTRFLLALDAFALATDAVAKPLLKAAEAFDAKPISLYDDDAAQWLDALGTVMLADLWPTLGAWATAPGRVIGARVRDRIERAAKLPPDVAREAQLLRASCTRRLH